MIRHGLRVSLALALLAAGGAAVQAAERILSYQSNIEIWTDGSLSVEETIRVRAEGRDIKRGIFREFPIVYKDRWGNRFRTTMTVAEVLRDGLPEAWDVRKAGRSLRIYIGRESVFLPPGEYTYTIRYRTTRQLGFFDDHDELYWNVTGNEWAFPIDAISATVRVPEDVPRDLIELEAYTGVRGATGQDYDAGMEFGSVARFTGTRRFRQGEGMTIVVSFPKGFVQAPTSRQRLEWLLEDNANLLAGLVGIALLLVYYISMWTRAGRDPAPGVIMPMYVPPEGYSPAAMRFVRRMRYDGECFAAALINLAVHGFIEIEEIGSSITLRRIDAIEGRRPPFKGDAVVLAKLLPTGRGQIELNKDSGTKIAAARKAHRNQLQRDFEGQYFSLNRVYVLSGIALSLPVLIANFMLLPDTADAGAAAFLTVWLTVWTFVSFSLLMHAVNVFRGARGLVDFAQALGATGFALPFLAGEVMGLWMYTQAAPVSSLLVLLGVVGINAVFYELMKAPTRRGRRLLDRVEGFSRYLQYAEKDELNYRHKVNEPAPEMFEKYLPFALALGVEQAWAERFAGRIARNELQQPTWYRGSNWNASNLSRSASNIAGSISSSVATATAPSSSSGSGGGGFSGGGGGGGGGGGW
ncbi:MAG: DUF2207 domain-containing protein [Gammaproteobacteria bacterium]|nr:DUF2207 domain-containing protein [Gammaproteobacteria bacterium]